MKVKEIRLVKESDQSFIFHHETEDFSGYHHHPEYELVWIKNGQGVRIVGDNLESFAKDDLVFLGSDLPHVWNCDQNYFTEEKFLGEGVVIQFVMDSFGSHFFDLPENQGLRRFLHRSGQGYELSGDVKTEIISIMREMLLMASDHRLYALMRIFDLLRSLNPKPLASTYFRNREIETDEAMKRVMDHLIRNFHRSVRLEQMLDVAGMSETTFYTHFKKTYRLSFKQYLIHLRIGYACRLIDEGAHRMSEIALIAGFDNLSNFNRQFKKIKGLTPRAYKHQRTFTSSSPK